MNSIILGIIFVVVFWIFMSWFMIKVMKDNKNKKWKKK